MTQEKQVIAEFPKCRACGNERLLGQEEMNKEVAEGRAGPDAAGALHVWKTGLVDPRVPALTMLTLESIIDACAECGTLRLIKATSARVAMTTPLIAP